MRSVYNTIGPYDIHQEIGRGGMAVVFLATDTTSGQRVALRTVPTYTAPDVLAAEQRGAELQEQFCRVSGFVPQVYKYGTESDYFYVAMEYLDGENLSQAIRRGPLPETRAVCDTLAVDPLALIGSGALLVATPEPDRTAGAIAGAGVPVTAIATLGSGDRRVRRAGRETPLVPPERDELWRVVAR